MIDEYHLTIINSKIFKCPNSTLIYFLTDLFPIKERNKKSHSFKNKNTFDKYPIQFSFNLFPLNLIEREGCPLNALIFN